MCEKSGGDLLSQGVSTQVPSALRGLTSVFGMGTGVALSLAPPKLLRLVFEDLNSEHELQTSLCEFLDCLSQTVHYRGNAS